MIAGNLILGSLPQLRRNDCGTLNNYLLILTPFDGDLAAIDLLFYWSAASYKLSFIDTILEGVAERVVSPVAVSTITQFTFGRVSRRWYPFSIQRLNNVLGSLASCHLRVHSPDY